MELFSDSNLFRVVWPSIWFALWHYAPGSVSPSGGVRVVAFSPDGTVVATAGGSTRAVRLWDAESGTMLRAFPHDDALMPVTFSPDGTLLASRGYDNAVYLRGIP